MSLPVKTDFSTSRLLVAVNRRELLLPPIIMQPDSFLLAPRQGRGSVYFRVLLRYAFTRRAWEQEKGIIAIFVVPGRQTATLPFGYLDSR